MKNGGKGYMLKGLKNMSPPGDSGMRPPSGRVNDNPTRDGVAPTPKTLGPRTA
jgi:hypothetical protein